MTLSASFPQFASRLILPGALLLFAGCQTGGSAIAVSSPPPPVSGSAPIAAYDAYALALQPHVGTPRPEHFILISAR